MSKRKSIDDLRSDPAFDGLFSIFDDMAGKTKKPKSKKVKKVEATKIPEPKKEKPKPVPKIKPAKIEKRNKPFFINELAALYEFHCRKRVVDDFTTWPLVTIEQAKEIVKDIDPNTLPEPYLSFYKNAVPDHLKLPGDEELGDNLIYHDYSDVTVFRTLLIEKTISVGMSIPLFIEYYNLDKDDYTVITLLYSWANHVRAMVDLRKKQGNTKSRNASSVQEYNFCFEIECNAAQAILLEKYCNASHGSLLACRDHLKSLGNKAPKRIDRISSKLATKIRNEKGYDDIPRSLIMSALNSYPNKLKFNSENFEKEIGKFYLKDNFKLFDDSITVGRAKNIAISKVIAGTPLDIETVGVSFRRLSPLRYEVMVIRDYGDYMTQQL